MSLTEKSVEPSLSGFESLICQYVKPEITRRSEAYLLELEYGVDGAEH